MAERWFVTGAAGQLGGHVLRALLSEGRDEIEILVLIRSVATGMPHVREVQIDLADIDALTDCVRRWRPTHIVHAGAVSAVGACRQDPQAARRVNTEATIALAEAAADVGARMLYTSTDMVFDGEHAPYRESDPPAPVNVYGRTKADAEQALLGREHVVIVRLPLLYGLPVTARSTTFVQQLSAARSGEPVRLFDDEYRTPVFLPDAARAAIALTREGPAGQVIHVSGPQRLSRYELIERVVELLGIRGARLERVSRLSIASPEPRPADLSLDGSRFCSMFPQLAPRPLEPRIAAELNA